MSDKTQRAVSGGSSGPAPEILAPAFDLATAVFGIVGGRPQAIAMAAAAGASNQMLADAASRLSSDDRPDRKAAAAGREKHEARGHEKILNKKGPKVHAWFREVDEFTDPEIRHDHGHLEGWDDRNANGIRDEADWNETRTGEIDASLREDPGFADYRLLAKWIAMLEGAELLRPDLVDATATYRHFLFGGGAAWNFSYDRFLLNDAAGAVVEASAIQDAEYAVLSAYDVQWWDDEADGRCEPPQELSFRMQSNVVSVGADPRYPYPATENWQKAIGGHPLWVQTEAVVTPDLTNGTRELVMDVTLRMEDMYNFNPGQHDIATGAPDAENGRLAVVGLGQEFLQRGEARRQVQSTQPLEGWAEGGGQAEIDTLDRIGAQRLPGNSRGNPVAR